MIQIIEKNQKKEIGEKYLLKTKSTTNFLPTFIAVKNLNQILDVNGK